METMTMDFEFTRNSLQHGQFLVECHETCPGIEVKDVTSHYLAFTLSIGKAVYSVDAPNELAVVLKLRFGQCLRERPAPKPSKDYYYDIQSISRQLNRVNKKVNNIKIYDYESSYWYDKEEAKDWDAKESIAELYEKIKQQFKKTIE